MAGLERTTPTSLSADLIPDNTPSPRIVNEWTQTRTYDVELAHNSDPADPQTNCTGTIKVKFKLKGQGEKKEFGTEQGDCQECKEQVTVSIAALALELGLI